MLAEDLCGAGANQNSVDNRDRRRGRAPGQRGNGLARAYDQPTGDANEHRGSYLALAKDLRGEYGACSVCLPDGRELGSCQRKTHACGLGRDRSLTSRKAYGTVASYYQETLLTSMTKIQMQLVGAMQCCTILFLSIFVGRFCDAGHVRAVLTTGTLVMFVGMFGLASLEFVERSFSKQYAVIILFQGLFLPAGMSCFFVSSSQSKPPPNSHHITLRRSYTYCSCFELALEVQELRSWHRSFRS